MNKEVRRSDKYIAYGGAYHFGVRYMDRYANEKIDDCLDRAFAYDFFYGKGWYWIPAMFLFGHGNRRKCRKLAW